MACPSSGEVGEDTAYFAEDFFPIGCQQNRQGGGDKENKRGGRIFDDNGFLIQIERVKLNLPGQKKSSKFMRRPAILRGRSTCQANTIQPN